jgi:hypothetical protein
MPGANATTQGALVWSAAQLPVRMTGGTLTFTTCAMGQGGTETYAVTFEDRSSTQGSFDAGVVPGRPLCG